VSGVIIVFPIGTKLNKSNPNLHYTILVDGPCQHVTRKITDCLGYIRGRQTTSCSMARKGILCSQ